MKLNEQRKILKIHSKDLKAAKWNLRIDPSKAYGNTDIIVSLNDSQILRWIDELNGVTDADAQIQQAKAAIKAEKKKKETSNTKAKIKELYNKLNNLKFKPDYLALIIDSKSDYTRANKGFIVNGIEYKRLLGTNGGIKNSTIVYVNEKLYPELKKRIGNGRNPNTKLIPAKLEAYQALVCSGSIPLPMPKGLIVVRDCITRFMADVITIRDGEGDNAEPILQYEDNYSIEHNNSDGCGLMLPSYSRKINQALNGIDETISGINTRFAFEKGMLFTFDFIEFAEKVAGTYYITDVWGQKRDIRDAEVILTESMLKLWDSYDSWEDYYNNCIANNYQFCGTKITPPQLESKRETNYQYLNPLNLTDADIDNLCKDDIAEIKDIMSLDYRKSIIYLAGAGLNENNYYKTDDYIQALMIEPETIKDPYILSEIDRNIRKRIDRLKIGKITIDANYSIIGGDLYALCQSMFNLPITGILKAGEIYNRYWQNADYVSVFRSPMSCGNSIVKRKIAKSIEADYWYRFIKTATILNAWDCTCDALNGADFDSDTIYITDNSIIVDNTKNLHPIICLQNKAEKIIPTEDDIIASNIVGFGCNVGVITNRITAMYDIQSLYPVGSAEYEELEYRIMCGQLLQQNTIDSVKGIITKPMPENWYKYNADLSELDKKIIADRKPYFMGYIYPKEMTEYKKYVDNGRKKAFRQFLKPFESLGDTKEEQEYIYYFNMRLPASVGTCTVNRICRKIENEFDDYKPAKTTDFDYTIYKSGVRYSTQKYTAAESIYTDYIKALQDFMKQAKNEKLDKDSIESEKKNKLEEFKRQLDEVIPDEETQTEILLDLCYARNNNKSKSFVWEMCGKQIIKNMLVQNDNTVYIPVQDINGDFTVKGISYKMKKERKN